MMDFNIDWNATLIGLSGVARVFALCMGIIAVHDVIRFGLHVKSVSWPARLIMLVWLLSLGATASASFFRMSGESWALVYRELAHTSYSLGTAAICALAIKAPSCRETVRLREVQAHLQEKATAASASAAS